MMTDKRTMNNINKDGIYIGSEVQWGVEDVTRILFERGKYASSREDLERILNASFEDNEMVMNAISESISITIDYMLDEGELKLNDNS